MVCVCSMSQIGFPPKRLGLGITLQVPTMPRNALPIQSIYRNMFQATQPRTESSLKPRRAVISTKHLIGEHTIKFKIIWESMEIGAPCLHVSLVMDVLLFAEVQTFE